MRIKESILLGFMLLVFGTLSFGVEPDEILKDEVLEKRAREISVELRCLVCRNENIDSSDANLAKDMRILVRERLLLGDSNEEVLNYVHARYGDFVLLRPKFSGSALILWFMAPFFFLMGAFLIYLNLFQKKKTKIESDTTIPLTNEEQKKINSLLKDK